MALLDELQNILLSPDVISGLGGKPSRETRWGDLLNSVEDQAILNTAAPPVLHNRSSTYPKARIESCMV